MDLIETVFDIQSEKGAVKAEHTSQSGCRKKVKSPKNYVAVKRSLPLK